MTNRFGLAADVQHQCDEKRHASGVGEPWRAVRLASNGFQIKRIESKVVLARDVLG
ncbi:hypothetical protein [Niveibacterium sp.]|uniref:hypothetical protein n=1 Tax=Niveibacterium sp. TaxID=2017444 RepID=UPI0035B338C6